MLNPVSDDFRAQLRSKLPPQAFRPLTPNYLEEPRGRYKATAGFVVAPSDAEQVSTTIRACAEARIGVVPYGGGTGLVGGQVAPDGPEPVILSLENMSAIRDLSTTDNVVVAEAGTVLQTLQQAASDADRLFPLSLASEGTARIGGNLSTNAGGLNTLRYGNARDLCLGLEAVLPDGQIWHGLSRLRKDNTGYDLRHLLIGAEGTLGIITAASLKLFPRPQSEATALLAVRDPQAALEILDRATSYVGTQISAFELIHRQGLDFLTETGMDYTKPLEEIPQWMVLIDIGTFAGADAEQALETLFEGCAERGLCSDGTIAQSQTQRDALWAIRETIPEANRRIGSVSSHDISVPRARIPEFITRAGENLAKLAEFRINCFGHAGDGNLHYNVFPAPGKTRADYEHLRAKVKTIVHDLTAAMNGSVSAEHGIGRLKTHDLARYSDPAKLSAMRAIKSSLDPAGIMNPGAVLTS
jgi:FAD/FMN-containing dehydrogenase